jgi:hypothetical protein
MWPCSPPAAPPWCQLFLIDAGTGDGPQPYFSDELLVRMATLGGAKAARMDGSVGALRPGLAADVVIWDGSAQTDYTAVVNAHPRDVVLVLRGGVPLYGDAEVVEGLGGGDGQCERIADAAPDDCLNGKRLCAERELGVNYATLKTTYTAYRLFYCGDPPGEPSCTPFRDNQGNDGLVFAGMAVSGDQDGDGVPDAMDNCPTMFNPPRPVDGFMQADADGDGVGDICDPCPLDPNTSQCSTLSATDRDNDGVPNDADNCPNTPNPDQADRDGDGKGDACDPCPDDPNPGAAGCPTTIYAIKQGQVGQGAAVHLNGVLVTAVGPRGFYAAMVDGTPGYTGPDYSAIFVFTGSAPSVTPGQRVSFDGTVTTFHAQLELTQVSGIQVGQSAPVPDPVVIADPGQAASGDMAARLEGQLVQVGPVQVSAVDASSGRFTIDGPLVVDNQLFQLAPLPAQGATLPMVTGHLHAFDTGYELAPRAQSDLISGPPRLTTLSPASVYLLDGQRQTFTASLDRAATSAQAVSLSATSGLALLDAGGQAITQVTIATGQLSATFQAEVRLGGATTGRQATVTA